MTQQCLLFGHRLNAVVGIKGGDVANFQWQLSVWQMLNNGFICSLLFVSLNFPVYFP
ncbi:hypothetical protein [Neisseria sp.]|uniref:hypothetical protein n=1 Tax=Neisseria sp. TaxID=192066 RepID=UPI0026DCA8D1|nr:hypothetical protein [Neisseria sp.]MDO4906442.1 hypothetical protein [Neisseria sp.]